MSGNDQDHLDKLETGCFKILKNAVITYQVCVFMVGMGQQIRPRVSYKFY